ncbi:DUF1951 domain-containing protein [Malacoplasma iowae]|uniref:DUF1951 domain-containing protein n=2 Tax=Malacoplasma iowae TaxID=2116 RepID=A0A084U3P5_MALIO|nr:DUF1951 domain-containing protein [Malacoplasma iowae]KFB07581.1 hypothetical protein P271_426 [Malacoplasma iowae DK-CPA]VEU61815.1 Uncharacterised protein [Mycoplasmopsis fermentans]WPL36151.1 DUF1951 domain-containing protein [Malacoplasma iowae]WPL36404.1 DUF1951 domain-containing protein [Malacoplasma iowae]WPL37432.1 DUF1951 domain-containing protein [Malacoplasma iowae]
MMNELELRQKFENNINKVVTNFNSICPDNESKLSFIKTAIKSDNMLEMLSSENTKLLKEAMEAFIDSAKVTETRKMQQAMLMPLLAKMFKDTPFSEMKSYFEQDSKMYSLFCMMFVTFKYEESLKKHGEEHHKDILAALDKYVYGITSL